MPVAASAIYFLNLRGDVLINRLYRDDVGHAERYIFGRMLNSRGNMVDAFRMHIMQTKELGTCPVRQIGGCSFLYMRISNVYIVIVVSSNANVACAFKFVVEAVALFKSYFGGAFDEDAIRNNFVLIYELLDDIDNCTEIMDFGYPQNLSPEILKLYITQEGVRSPFSSKPSEKPVPNATLQVTGAVGWRREGLVYKKNEVFLDIVESVNLLMSSKGSVLRCDVTGKILMKCFLSGMPDLKLGLNDKIGLEKEAQLKSRPAKRTWTSNIHVTWYGPFSRSSSEICQAVAALGALDLPTYDIELTPSLCSCSAARRWRFWVNERGMSTPPAKDEGKGKNGKTIELDDVTFHQCVNLTRFNSEKTVSFVPPDGEFELMKYRITEGVNLPFRVLPTIKELGRTRMEINVKVKSVFGAKMFALGVVVKVPVPKQTAKTSFQTTSGKAKYNASIDSLVWKIRKFPGQTEATMSAEVELISTMGEKKSWNRPPIQMEFQVPMFTASGLRVRFLKVWEKSGYNTVEWVRYITRAGSYEIRC
ncbi:AP-2 complex subunit mu [Zea mays]|uniref:AP-2 complex subunit mu n=1 Tax=Zea mays TaxID=4577 RepID=A0A3L6EFF5_MAIZE|nr:AP-2 complex subunit mu [Zea mays]